MARIVGTVPLVIGGSLTVRPDLTYWEHLRFTSLLLVAFLVPILWSWVWIGRRYPEANRWTDESVELPSAARRSIWGSLGVGALLALLLWVTGALRESPW